MKTNVCYLGDCLEVLPEFPDNSVDLTLTDIPYNEVNRESQGLRVLDKENADILTFDLDIFLEQILRVSKNSIIIFCGREQFSGIYNFFAQQKGTVRPIVWQKSNPSPMNGQHIYLSGVEFAVWFKKAGAKTFNAHCKNTVFKYSNGSSKLHPTEKNHDLLKELILDNSNEGDIVFDPCCGSGSHLLVSRENNRKYIGIELDTNYFKIATERVGCEIIKHERLFHNLTNDTFVHEQVKPFIENIDLSQPIIKTTKNETNICECGGKIIKLKSGIRTCEDCLCDY